jgi:hypothetical protein
MKVELQPRDRLLINLSYEQQFVVVSHAHRYLFSGIDQRERQRRIYELERAGFIRREPTQLIDKTGIIRLTKSGIKLAEADRAERIPQLRSISVQTLLHDSIVTAVRLRLSQLWHATWIPERLIKSDEFPQVPDGMVVFPSGTTLAIEVENSPKGPKRFREIQERWRNNRVKLCLYVASNEALYRCVKKYMEQGPKDLPFGLVLWRELENGTPHVWMPQGMIDIFSRREL